MTLIEVEHLTKTFRVFDRREGVLGAVKDLFHRRYHSLEAVDDISFSIERGETVGYIGPNGAGKSTTIKMLTGILVPSSGKIQVDGLVPHRDRHTFTHQIGVVFGQRTQLWWDIAVIESFRLLGRIYQVPESVLDARIRLLDPILDLTPLLHTPVRKLSLGQRMRCDLAASLLHSPPILFLDEPTIGLDVVAKDSVRAFLKEINRTFETTVLLTTHDLRDIEELCRRVIVIDHGHILFDGALEDMKSRHAGRVHLDFDLVVMEELGNVSAAVGHVDLVTLEQLGPCRFRASFEKGQLKPANLVKDIVNHLDVADLAIEEDSIEEVVRRIYSSGGGVRKAGETFVQPPV